MTKLIPILILSLLLIACAAGKAGTPPAVPEIEGPALVMFYTDN